ncbi:cobalamin-binding protein [Inmirania thermothiophila]|uniref:Iron complex transport system substrate-binding protein n=1 Tax=Inmirania thermothiophila TaxID=1750597 RepID=A0A3N1XZQ3_9GAMM|nr:cobalamin-binding protein [Inmirania thermothiophila]ROR32050.1 iron complex transport system substrate-binding protein [Inmirania thermothiophila]
MMRAAAVLWLVLAALPAAAVTATDDRGVTVRLAAPARRIVSLAPHATELLFAAGAGGRIVGAVEWSDYPPEARAIPRVGGYRALDLERIVALHPDLVVGWASGNGAALTRLEAAGLAVFATEPRRLEDIAAAIEALGRLAGTEERAGEAAARFRARLAALRARWSGRRPVRVFYQVWDRPLITVGGPQIISRLIELCGGRNVFAQLAELAPTVTVEAVIAADPDAIVFGLREGREGWAAFWRRFPFLRAVGRGHLIGLDADLLQRPTPRLLDGAERLCRALEAVRSAEGGP